MSTIVVNYNKLCDTVAYAEKGIKCCKNYIDDLKNVQKKLTSSDVRNVEDGGGVSSALSLAQKKLDEAESFKYNFTECAKMINNAKVKIQEKDKAAGKNINTIMDSYMGRRGILSKAKEFIYRQYVNFLDKIGGLGDLGKTIKNRIKNAEVGFVGWIENVKNWFKYGEGKYVGNILDGLKNVVLAAAGLVVAAGAVVTGPVWLTVVGVVGVVASGIYLICQMIDTKVQVDENTKAYILHKEGKITASRYYGDIDGFGEKTKRYDYGDQYDNNIVEELGKVHDFTKVTSKLVAKVCTMVTGFAKLGVTSNAQGEKIVDWDRAKMAYKYKHLHDAGFNSNDYQTGGFSGKTAFSPEAFVKNIISTKTTDTIEKYTKCKMSLGFGYLADSLKTWDKMVDIKKGVKTLATPDSSAYDKVGAFMDTAGKTAFVDSLGSDIWDVVELVKKYIPPKIPAVSDTLPSSGAAAFVTPCNPYLTPNLAGGGGWSRF